MSCTRRNFVIGAAGAAGLAAVGGIGAANADEAQVSTYEALAELNPQDEDYRANSGDLSAVFSPWQFGGLTLNHRMVKSSAGSDTWNRKDPAEFQTYYANMARGGVELCWVEDIRELEHFPRGRRFDAAEADPLLEGVAAAIHEAGAYAGYQIYCMSTKFSGFDPATAGQYESACAEHLTREEIGLVQADFINCAKRMQELGFDAIEVNAAGNNIGQAFFSRMRNHRDDEYGPQSFENRARFVTEIVRGIKEQCGEDFPVQVLINGIEENDLNLGQNTLSTTVEETCEIAKMLEAAGANALHVRLGPFGMHVCQFASDLYFSGRGIEGTTSYGTQFDFKRHWQGKLQADHSGCGLMLNVTREVKQAVSIPVGGVTYMDPAHAPDLFQNAIANGDVDFLIMNRPFTVDPQYVNKLREGRIDEIAPCCRCMHCHYDKDEEGKTIERCRVNACTQRAFRDDMPEGYEPIPAETPKKVMVVGGGPAGMEAARIAAQRGHEVVLYEKNGMLGGLLPFASAVKGPHENLDDLIAYLIRQQELAGVQVVLDTEVNADVVAGEAPDAVVIATGGIRPELGLEGTAGTKVVAPEAALFEDLGEEVTILGGGCQAVDLALLLLEQGKKLNMVMPDPVEQLDKEQSAWVRTFVTPMIFARGTKVWPNASLAAIGDGEITIAGDTGVDMVVPCSAVIPCFDLLPDDSLSSALEGVEVYAVGDCAKPWNIQYAITNANLAARKI